MGACAVAEEVPSSWETKKNRKEEEFLVPEKNIRRTMHTKMPAPMYVCARLKLSFRHARSLLNDEEMLAKTANRIEKITNPQNTRHGIKHRA